MITKIFLFSFLSSFSILSVIMSGFFGETLKIYTSKILSNNKFEYYLILITCLEIIFIICFILYFYNTVVFLDDEKITLNADNTVFNFYGLTSFGKTLGNTAAFNGGLLAAAKIIKNGSYPLGFKDLFVGIGGVSSLLVRLRRRNINTFYDGKTSTTNVDLRAEIKIYSKNDTVSTNLNGKFVETKDDIKFEANSPLEDGDLFNNYVSNLLEILQNSFLISVLISVLLLLIFAFLFIKFIADKDYKFNWIKNLYLGDKIHYLVVKILALWGRTSILWVFLGLLFIIIINLFNSFFLFYLLNEFNNIFKR